MKKIFLAVFILAGISSFFAGCEKTDYQHPMHRSNDANK